MELDQLVKGAEDLIAECLKMPESSYTVFGPTSATLAQAMATLALVKLLDCMYASNDNALRVVSLR